MTRSKVCRQRKLRGIPRRLRALRKWANDFSGYYPSEQELDENPKYCNWKIPVAAALVEGPYTTQAIQRECAQLLIDACGLLIAARPVWAAQHRITCLICIPDVFSSEVCIYLDESYYQSKSAPLVNEHGCQELIMKRSLVDEWALSLPKDVAELGIFWRYDASVNEDDHYASEHWMYGNVSDI
jgi:hypothetical protein